MVKKDWISSLKSFLKRVVKKEGYNQILDFLLKTANNEKEHAKIWFKLLKELGDTSYNLEKAAIGEHDEWENMYPRMAKEAREEGFEQIALLFEKVAEIEKELKILVLVSIRIVYT